MLTEGLCSRLSCNQFSVCHSIQEANICPCSYDGGFQDDLATLLICVYLFYPLDVNRQLLGIVSLALVFIGL